MITPIDYTPYANGDERLSIRTKLNNLGSDVSNLSTEVQTELDVDRARLDELESITDYQYAKTVNHTVTNNVYETIVHLATGVRKAGVYQLSFCTVFSYSTTGRSGFIRVSTDSGATWQEFRREAKDTTDKLDITYITATVLPEQTHDVLIQARKESSNDIMEIYFSNIISQFKHE